MYYCYNYTYICNDPSARPQTEFLCKPIQEVMEQESLTRNHLREASGKHLGGIWTASRRHLEGIWEASGRHLEASGRHLQASGGIWKHLEASGSIWKHLEASGSIWKHLGDTWETSGKHLGGIGEASGRLLGGIWEAAGTPGDHGAPAGSESQKSMPLSTKMQKLHLFGNFTKRF